MIVRNLTTRSDAEFLAESIKHWQDALRRGDWPVFHYRAVHCFCFAQTLQPPVQQPSQPAFAQ
jgi:hypothetical protein